MSKKNGQDQPVPAGREPVSESYGAALGLVQQGMVSDKIDDNHRLDPNTVDLAMLARSLAMPGD